MWMGEEETIAYLKKERDKKRLNYWEKGKRIELQRNKENKTEQDEKNKQEK